MIQQNFHQFGLHTSFCMKQPELIFPFTFTQQFTDPSITLKGALSERERHDFNEMHVNHEISGIRNLDTVQIVVGKFTASCTVLYNVRVFFRVPGTRWTQVQTHTLSVE